MSPVTKEHDREKLLNEFLAQFGYKNLQLNMKTIAISADHRGFKLKELLKEYLIKAGHNVIDCGTNSEERADYPVYGKKAAEMTVSGESDFGITICGSGIGVSIAANKVKGARAVNVNTVQLAEMSRRHNNANVIAIGSDFVTYDDAVRYIEIFIATEFDSGERHHKRVDQINEM